MSGRTRKEREQRSMRRKGKKDTYWREKTRKKENNKEKQRCKKIKVKRGKNKRGKKRK